MLAFQRYCKIHKSKMMYFTGFIGLMSLLGLIAVPAILFKEGPAMLVEDPLVKQLAFGFPITFIFLLFIQRIFHLYIEGNFFSPQALLTIQQLARVCLLYGLIIEPGILILVKHFYTSSLDEADSFVIHYLFFTNFPLAVLGYALHLVSAVNKVAREIDEEQKLTV